MTKVLLLGASGATGSAALKLLEQTADVELHVLARKPQPDNFKGKWHHQKDLLPVPNITPDHIICCLGTTRKIAGSAENFIKIDHDLVVNLAKAFHKQNPECTFSYVSSVGANPYSYFLYPSSKGKTENDLLAIKFKNCYIMRPGLLVTTLKRPENRWIDNYMNMIVPYLPFKDYFSVSVDKVAQCMIKLIKTPSSQVIFENGDIHKFTK
eukprot:NODE_51_length_31136_cov_0.357670.p19 type:complete len:210 gc:universal NODE_51_length_31136_cov_0.357670:27711-27082(-)